MIVVELGRRVHFDFDKYGHTPTCLDRGDQELAGKTATVLVLFVIVSSGAYSPPQIN